MSLLSAKRVARPRSARPFPSEAGAEETVLGGVLWDGFPSFEAVISGSDCVASQPLPQGVPSQQVS